jgi:hypothetical protein
MATCPWPSSTPTCGDGVSATGCCRDFISACPKGAGAVRRYRPGRRTRAPAAGTKARGTKPQARRPHRATVTRSSSWSVELTDPAATRPRGARQETVQ